jgi:hypothetical protein
MPHGCEVEGLHLPSLPETLELAYTSQAAKLQGFKDFVGARLAVQVGGFCCRRLLISLKACCDYLVKACQRIRLSSPDI